MAPQAELALLDTNILVYAMNKDAAQHGACRALLDRALVQEIPVGVAPQVLFEYFAVVTSAKQMTIPLSTADAANDVEYLRRALPVIHPGPRVIARTLDLLRVLGHSGRHVFDIVLAATMMENGIKAIYTYDDRFAKVPGIVALTPHPVG
jgi:toxin-antitoxin system PIN domain toxin